jgi:outer membrane protein OmpA-like peptidoglycan-associated protein
MRRRAILSALPLSLLAACSATDPLGADLARQPVRLVFFEDDSIALGANAMNVVQDAAQVAMRYPGAPVRLLGFVAPDPTHAPSVSLSRARAEHVAGELVRMGVPRGRIQIEGRGAVPFQSAEVESRRVEIHIGN